MSDLDLQDLLADLEVPAGNELSVLLEELRDLGAGPVPQPSAAVADLLLAPAVGRPVRSRRTAIISAIVLVSLGTGATAAAADPMLRRGAADAVAAVAQVVRPAPQPPAKAAPPPVVAPPRPGTVSGSGSASSSSRAIDASVPTSVSTATDALPGSGSGAPTHRSNLHPRVPHPRSTRHDGSGEGHGPGADRRRGTPAGADEGRSSGADHREALDDSGRSDGSSSADDESDDRSDGASDGSSGDGSGD